jgi:hypothetical protein
MVGLGGLEPPTSPLSVLRSLLLEYYSSRYRIRSGYAGTRRFKRATSVGMSWDLERKTTIPGWDFGGYAWTFAKSRSSVINTRSSARQRSESTESPAPESFSSETVSASKPASRRIGAYCSWTVFVDFKLQALISSGKSTVPSRVNSAAYANAASTSGSVSAG